MSKTRSRRDRRRAAPPEASGVCPECGAEYVAGVETCADCHVPLVPALSHLRLASADGLEEVGRPFDGDLADEMSAALANAGIPHHTTGALSLAMVFVRPGDMEEARVVYDGVIAVAEFVAEGEASGEVPRARDLDPDGPMSEAGPREEPAALTTALVLGTVVAGCYALAGSRPSALGALTLLLAFLATLSWKRDGRIVREASQDWEREEAQRLAERDADPRRDAIEANHGDSIGGAWLGDPASGATPAARGPR